MASTALRKETAGSTGILRLLLLGLLLPSVLVSGLPSTAASTSTASTAANTMTTQPITTSGTAATSTIMQPTTSTTSGPTTTSTTIQALTATSGNTATPSTQSATSSTFGAPNQSSQYQSMPTSGFTTSMMSTSPSSNSTSVMPGMIGPTTLNATSMSMIYCPSFTCNYSDCYTMYTSQNATSCAAGVGRCQLIRQADMCYTVSCSADCADSCVNATQTNCSVDCCNSTGCLNGSFASMMMTTTTVNPNTTTTATTTTPRATTTTTSKPPTTANNGNKCHRGTCTGIDCYTGFLNAAVQTCSSSQPHCQLKKETVDSNLQWTAGCIANCSGQTSCKASTPPPCHLECCNATRTSCLWLNGTLHVPNFTTRGPPLHGELIATSLCLLAFALLL